MQNRIKRRKAVIVVVLLGLCWFGMLAGDWCLRFKWYGWQKSFVIQKQVDVVSFESLANTSRVATTRGGDLSGMIGIPSVSEPFEQPRPACVEMQDEFGYRNEPPVKGAFYPIVVVGDSYMKSGLVMTNMFSARLAEVAGMPVYNHAVAGRGPVHALQAFFDSGRFDKNPPRLLILGLLEREIHTAMLAGSMVYDLWLREHPEDRRGAEIPIIRDIPLRWIMFSSRSLKSSLPNSSAIAQASAKFWNKMRYFVFGRITPDVVVGGKPVAAKPMLFYREAIDHMKWGNEYRNIDQIVWALKYLDDFCARRSIRLLVLLIPDKAQVYRDCIPAHLNSEEDPIPRSCLWAIEKGLREENVPVVNLLGPFREQAAENMLVYWPDDTHWNAKGLALAARLTWEEIRGISY